jgi:phosphate transport system protein
VPATLAVNIAEATARYLSHPPVKVLADIPRMATLAQGMLHDALESFISRDITAAQRVLERRRAV